MLATKVIAAGITHLTDARYFAAWEVDFLAFPLGGADGISWDYLNALREWVAGPTIVAELAGAGAGAGSGELNGELDAWMNALREHDVDHVLLPYPAPASASARLRAAGITTFLQLPVAGYERFEDVKGNLEELPATAYLILDFTAGGITWADLQGGYPFGLAELETLLQERPCLLRIDLGAADPQAIKAAYSLKGFAVRGSSEEKVGYKSFDDLDGLFEGLEVFE